MSHSELETCSWAQGELYVEYHDKEWGVPTKEVSTLFECLCLEGQQAGLSWITVLKKREGYRQRFFNFDPEQVAKMSDEDIERCLEDPGVIRHRGKLEAIRKNARAWVSHQQQGEDMVAFLWSFVGGEPHINRFATLAEVPSQTEVSLAMSKALKKKGFGFVGPTTCYAFMQAVGMVNDHLTTCPYHPDNL